MRILTKENSEVSTDNGNDNQSFMELKAARKYVIISSWEGQVSNISTYLPIMKHSYDQKSEILYKSLHLLTFRAEILNSTKIRTIPFACDIS